MGIGMTVTDEAKPTVMYDAAEALARLGVSVIPIQASTKEPPPGFKWGEFSNRMADASERYAWFVESGHHLAAVLDVISGGLIVLDFDSPDGFDRMAARYPVINTYPRVKTARGHHVWIRSEQRTKKYTINLDGGNLEVRAGRHYVLVPPSTHPSGEVYRWEVPPWAGIPTVDLATLGLQYVDPDEQAPGDPITNSGKPLSNRDILHMVEALAPHYKEGQRNPLILAVAGWMAYHDVPESDVVKIADKLREYAPGPDDANKLRQAIRRTYRKISDGYAVAGWSALTDSKAPLISPGAAKRLDLLLRYRDPKLSYMRDTGQPEPSDEESEEAPETHFRIMPFNALRDLPIPKQIVREVLQEGTVAVLFGDGGSLKSFLALDLAFHIANGEEWHGHPVEQGEILYIAAEGAPGMELRRAAWSIHHDLPTDNAWILPDSVQLTDETQLSTLIDDLQTLAIKPKFIVIDTLSQNAIGSDENSSTDMAIVMNGATLLARTFGCTVLIVHHSNKMRGFRGSTVIRNNVTTFMQMERDEKADTVTLKCDKQKDLEEFSDMIFTWEQIVVIPARGLMPAETSLVLELTSEAGKGKSVVSGEKIVLALGRLGWASYEDLAKELEVSRRHLERVIPGLVEKRVIKEREQKSGRTYRKVFAMLQEDDDAPDF